MAAIGSVVNPLSKPVRVALVGCGAVAQLYYRPALETLQREGLLRLVAAHDPNRSALDAFCASFPSARRMASFQDLLGLSPQLVVIASPPRYHPEQTIAALEADIDVHCEKPLAPTLAEGERMVAAGVAAGRRLSVGMLRRHFPATRAIARLIANGAIGPLQSVDCFEGGPFRWPVTSSDYFRPAAGAAGVLQDIGTHCLDLLTWWLGLPSAISYQDDAMGGVEANCRIALTFGDVQATVRLSRDWAQPNRYVVTGRDGWLAWTVNETNHFDYGISGTAYAGDFAVHAASGHMRRPALGALSGEFDEAFANQIRVLVDDTSDPDENVSAADTVVTLGLIDRCYATRRRLPMPWMVTTEEVPQ